MPLKVYCASCFEPNEYTLTKPIFCGHCGSKIEQNVSVSNNSNKSIKVTPMVQVKEIEEYTPENFNVKIQVMGDDGAKFDNIAHQQKTGYKEGKSKKVNKKTFFNEFRKEAGMGGSQPIEINDNGSE